MTEIKQRILWRRNAEININLVVTNVPIEDTRISKIRKQTKNLLCPIIELKYHQVKMWEDSIEVFWSLISGNLAEPYIKGEIHIFQFSFDQYILNLSRITIGVKIYDYSFNDQDHIVEYVTKFYCELKKT